MRFGNVAIRQVVVTSGDWVSSMSLSQVMNEMASE